MQLSLTYKRCSCEQCDSNTKDCLIPKAKLINEKGTSQTGQPVRHRTFSRARQARPRARHSYGNQQHRLDHTYAAAEVTSSPLEAPAAAMNSGHQQQQQQQQRQLQQQLPIERLLKVNGSLGAAWSPKVVDLQCRQRPRDKVTYDDKNKENKPPLTEFNGKLKQYQKYRLVNSKIQGITTMTIDSGNGLKSLSEENKRWIAATALLELSRVPVIFYN